MARRELARRARIDRIEQEIGRKRAELTRLQAEEERLQVLGRDLEAGLHREEQPLATRSSAPTPLQLELEFHLLALQRIQAEICFLRASRARITDQVREALLAHLTEPSPSAPAPPNSDAKEAANA